MIEPTHPAVGRRRPSAWLAMFAACCMARPSAVLAEAPPTYEETAVWLRRTLDRHAHYVSKDVTDRYWLEGHAGCELKIGNRWNSRRSITQIPLKEVGAKSFYVTKLEGQRAVVGFESPNDSAFLTKYDDGPSRSRYDFTLVVDRHDIADRVAQALKHLARSCEATVEAF